MKLFETNGNLRHNKTQERVANVGYQARAAIHHLIDCGCTTLEIDAVVNCFIWEIMQESSMVKCSRHKDLK